MAKAKPRTVQREVGHLSGPLQRMMNKAHLRSEGHPLDLIPVTGVLSSGTQHFGLDLSSAPVPQRRYAADICAVIASAYEVKVIFAQCCLMGDTIDSALAIRMSPHAVKMLADSLRDIVEPSIQELAERMGIEAEELSTISSKPKQTANMVANICSIATSGHETCLDFYHASAFANKNAETTGKLEVEPVVRVDVRTSLFLPLIARIFELEKEFADLTARGNV